MTKLILNENTQQFAMLDSNVNMSIVQTINSITPFPKDLSNKNVFIYGGAKSGKTKIALSVASNHNIYENQEFSKYSIIANQVEKNGLNKVLVHHVTKGESIDSLVKYFQKVGWATINCD